MQAKKVKRFFKTVEVAKDANTYRITLDGKPLRTPERNAIELPTAKLAEEVALEWSQQGEDIKPLTMPMTRLVCTAIDKVRPAHPLIVRQIAGYGQSDLLCYRSEGPDDLVAHQAKHWQPMLDWMQAQFQVSLTSTQGIVHVAQPADSLAKLHEIVGRYEVFRLTGIAELTQLTGSLVIALAFDGGHATAEEVVVASQLDDDWQADKWGEDSEALQRRRNLEADILVATRFLESLNLGSSAA